MQQFLDCNRLARLDEHARAARLPSALGDRRSLRERDFLVLECVESEIRRHQLRQRRRLDALVDVAARDRLAADDVNQEPGAGGDRRRRRHLRLNHQRQENDERDGKPNHEKETTSGARKAARSIAVHVWISGV